MSYDDDEVTALRDRVIELSRVMKSYRECLDAREALATRFEAALVQTEKALVQSKRLLDSLDRVTAERDALLDEVASLRARLS